jgi:large subunit ribosomal protein L35
MAKKAKKYKMKTKRALMKRVRMTKSGKLIRKSAYTGHLSRNKTTKQKRQARKSRQISASDYKRIKALLGR